MQNPVEGPLEVYEDVVEVLVVLEIFLKKDSQVKDLLCGDSSCCEACLFLSNHLLLLRIQAVQYDLRGHFQCLLLENFVFWYCSLLIGSASSLECNQSGCGVVHLGYARSIFWMLCVDQKCSPTQDRKRWQTPDV